jgi:hypothetical protein
LAQAIPDFGRRQGHGGRSGFGRPRLGRESVTKQARGAKVTLGCG